MDTPPPLPVTEEAKWPMKTILFIGYFGNKTPEGRRFHNRSMGALVVLLFLVFGSFPAVAWLARSLAMDDEAGFEKIYKIFGHLLCGVTFSFIAWSFWKYVNELDELARGMQLQAVCLTYLTGMAVMPFVALLGIVKDWNIDPFIAFILLEPVRGFWLWRLARHYQ